MQRSSQRRWYAFIILFTVIFWGIYGASFCDAKKITIAGYDSCPHSCNPELIGESGYIIDITKAVFEKAGHTVEYHIMSFPRALEDAFQGKLDGMMAYPVPTFADFAMPENEIGLSVLAFFVKQGNSWEYTGPDSLAAMKFGTVKGYNYGELTDYITQNPDNIDEISGKRTLERNIQKILKGRIDVTLEDAQTTRYYLAQEELAEKIKNAGTFGRPFPIFIAFSPVIPEAAEYAQILSDGIEALRTSGELAAILKKYDMQDWK